MSEAAFFDTDKIHCPCCGGRLPVSEIKPHSDFKVWCKNCKETKRITTNKKTKIIENLKQEPEESRQRPSRPEKNGDSDEISQIQTLPGLSEKKILP
ncbi:MAG: hypothetical protein QME51_04350 [Planctomycetota bacterium]|nr:hypothetical protein [Planctomycetota bacterium]